MALVPINTYATEIAPHVDGCPTAVIATYIRKVFIDLCERGKIWRVQLTPMLLSSGDYEYQLASPVAETEVSALLNAQVAKASVPSVNRPLDISTMEVAQRLFRDWPNANNTGEPRLLFQMAPSAFNIAPVPGALDSYTVKLKAAIRPTMTAANVESSLMNEYRRAWFHGTIHELMMMPGRMWSNDKLALYHGKQWEYFMNSARARANKGFGRTTISVRQRPWA